MRIIHFWTKIYVIFVSLLENSKNPYYLGRTAEEAAEAEGKPEFPKLTIGMSRACRCMPSKAALVLGV